MWNNVIRKPKDEKKIPKINIMVVNGFIYHPK